MLSIGKSFEILNELDHGVIVLDFPEADQHVVNDIPGKDVGIIETTSHGMKSFGQLITGVGFATLP